MTTRKRAPSAPTPAPTPAASTNATPRVPAPPPRGVLRTQLGVDVTHQRVVPVEPLRPWVEHLWWVAWSLDAPLVQETLPHPSFHLTFEHVGAGARGKPLRAELAAVHRGRFVRTLEGTGGVLGVKFRPGMLPWLPGRAAALVDRTAQLTSLAWLPEALRELARTWRPFASLDAGARSLEPLLATLCTPHATFDEAIATRDLVERAARDASLVRVDDLAALAGLDVRTLQRRFARYVGVSPKWVLRRYRLHEAAERLKAAPDTSLARLAAELGYADQPHFARDFRAVVGRSPAQFAAQLAAQLAPQVGALPRG